jgi:hypothetical protein
MANIKTYSFMFLIDNEEKEIRSNDESETSLHQYEEMMIEIEI